MTEAAATERPQVVHIGAARFVTIPLAASMTGLTVKAIETYIAKSKWAEGKHYRRRGGRVYIDMKEYESWVAEETV